MSRRAWWLLTLLTGVAPGLHGQGTPSSARNDLASLRKRADSLLGEWRRANALADLVDSVQRARAGARRDTIRVGALVIITNPSSLPLRQAARRAWPVIDSLYGPEAASLARHPWLITAVDPDTTIEPRVRFGSTEVAWDVDVPTLTTLLLATVPMPPPDPALRSWLGAGTLLPPIQPGRRRAAVYVQLITALSPRGRSCFLGDLDSCRTALGLADAPDPLARWYPSLEERRALVTRSLLPYFTLARRHQELEACTRGDDSVCIELLRSLPPGAVPPPLDAEARRTFVDVALQLGGRNAYHRLLASHVQPLAGRLAAAAGVDLDSLTAQWRAQILASRPTPVPMPRGGVWAALAWAGALAGCGLASSRWRVH